MKVCSKCKIEKEDIDFYNINKYWCIFCEKEYKKIHYINNKNKYNDKNKQYRKDNKESIKDIKKQYAEKNIEHIQNYQKEYRKNNIDKSKEYIKQYNILNKEHLKQYIREYRKNRKDIDIIFKCRCIISNSIYKAIKLQNYYKDNSCLQYLPYTIQELKEYLENQFEPWMNWNNWGQYKINEWNDNDLSTWKWNIDHIIPQSELIYTSMEEDNFKLCWALENLRPYSAKQNLLDGNRRKNGLK